MPKYENAVVYKLCCKDASITDEYIGSTCNKHKRKQEHKNCCNNENRKAYNRLVYQFIRANGGFINWDMIILEEYSCESKVQLEMKEREYIERLRPTLNKQIPTRTSQEYYQEHREDIKEYKKRHYQENIEDIKEYKKRHYQENREEILERDKQYRERKSQKFDCECGGSYTNPHKSHHIKTQRHLKYLEDLNKL
jgi:hypothetical protein